jgi:hypothetical protein
MIDTLSRGEQAIAAMNRPLSLWLCLSLSVFTIARAMEPSHTLPDIAKAAQNELSTHKAYSQSVAEDEDGAPGEDPGEEGVPNNDDGIQDASGDEGEDLGDDETDDQGVDGAEGDDASDVDDDGGGGGGIEV